MRSAIETAEAVRRGEMKATEAVEQSLFQIERHEPAVNAFALLDRDGAMIAAKAIDEARARGESLPPLAGVVIGVKDSDPVRGLPCRHGSLFTEGALPEPADSVQVARLRAAGAIIIGKLTMAEFGMDGATSTLLNGITRNPWDLSRTPGGSSGGSAAAVAAAMMPMSVGGDSLGSLRGPAGFTGLVGLKPSLGRVPRPDAFIDTGSNGALTVTVADTARYLDVVSGPDDHDRMSLPKSDVVYETAIESLPVKGLRIGYSADLGFAPVTDEVRGMCLTAVRDLAREAGLILATEEFTCVNAYSPWLAIASRGLRRRFEFRGWLPDQIDRISTGPLYFMNKYPSLSLEEEYAHQGLFRTLVRQMADFYAEHDVLITPTTCCGATSAEGPVPDEIEGRDARDTNAEPYAAVASICWNPSVSIPVGVTRGGLPIGMTLNGRRHRDDVVLRLARIWEQSRPWPRHAPGYAEPTQ